MMKNDTRQRQRRKNFNVLYPEIPTKNGSNIKLFFGGFEGGWAGGFAKYMWLFEDVIVNGRLNSVIVHVIPLCVGEKSVGGAMV